MPGFEAVGTFDLFHQIQGVGRFDQEIISAEFHAFDSCLNRSVPGEHQNLEQGVDFLDFLQGLDSVPSRHQNIQDNDIDSIFLDP